MLLQDALLQDAHDLSELEDMARDFFEIYASLPFVEGKTEEAMVRGASDYAYRQFGERLLFFSGFYAMENASTDTKIVHEITGFGELRTVVVTPFLDQLPENKLQAHPDSVDRWQDHGLGLMLEPLLPDLFDERTESLSELHGIAGHYDQLVLPINNNFVSLTSLPF